MLIRVKRMMSQPRPLPSQMLRPRIGSLVIVLRGFAAGLIGQVEPARAGQAALTNKVPVRLCGPDERVWMVNWRRLRLATPQEVDRWGRETYAAHVARMNEATNAVDSKERQVTHEKGRQI